MAAAVRPETRLLFVANPNNPTGTHVGRAAVEKLFREVPPEVIIVMDEAYIEYADADDYPDSLELRGLRERLVVLRTFSKIYGMAALRVGFAVGPAQLIDYMNRVRAPFNVNAVGQAAAMAALDDHEHVERSRRINQSERARLLEALGAMPGVNVAPSQANFVFVDVGRSARDVYDKMLRRGVIVRPLGPLETCLRITVGRPEENTRMLEALGEVLAVNVPRRIPLLLLVALALVLGGCPKKDEVVVQTSAGKGLTAADIDRDPLALLPGGAVALVVVRRPADVRVAVRPEAAGDRQGAGAVSRLGGLRASSGTSSSWPSARTPCRVRTWSRWRPGLSTSRPSSRAASGTAKTPLGLPVTASNYAGRTLYTSATVGFVVLTSHTVLLGDETGIRRALDRIQEGRVSQQMPDWFKKLLDTPNAPFVAGFDLRTHPVTDAMRQQLPFLEGMETARMLGNFQPPGVNLAGHADLR